MDNGMRKRTIEIDVADAPMLLGAMRIAANTAMLCQHRDAEKRLRQYQEMFAALSPTESEWVGREVWAEIGMALLDATSFQVSFAPVGTWSGDGPLRVVVGDQAWETRWSTHKKGDGHPAALCAALQEIAPLGCDGSFDDGLSDWDRERLQREAVQENA